MADFQPITKADFTDRTWKRCPDFLFVAGEAVCPLTALELPKAMMYMPIAFTAANDEYTLVALLGLHPGENLYVNSSGQWLGKYVPALYRTYPFVMAKNEAVEDQQVLCIDEDSGLLDTEDAERRFFDEEGELSSELNELMHFLADVNASRDTTQRICKQLQAHDLLKSWKFQVRLGEDKQHKVEGLYCIDEAALNALSDDAFIELRKAGVLPLAYCQLLSMQRVSLFEQLLKVKARSGSGSLPDELILDPIEDTGTINFDNL